MKKKATNPFQIGVQRNEQMGCWDLHLQIGNTRRWVKTGDISSRSRS